MTVNSHIFFFFFFLPNYQNIVSFLEVAHDVGADVEQLPEAVPRGDYKAVPATDASTFIAFNLQTTDISKQIVIISFTR